MGINLRSVKSICPSVGLENERCTLGSVHPHAQDACLALPPIPKFANAWLCQTGVQSSNRTSSSVVVLASCAGINSSVTMSAVACKRLRLQRLPHC